MFSPPVEIYVFGLGIEGRRACGGERVLDGLWATYIPGALGAGRLASDCNGVIGCARAAGVGRDEHIFLFSFIIESFAIVRSKRVYICNF